MAGLIPQSFIDDLLARTDVIEIISERINLKKTGRNYQALCPFHKEKSPSFSANQEKQFYYCFGCGASGNALGFVMDYDQLGFPEAVELLARRAGLEVPRDVGAAQKTERYSNLYKILEKASEWYQQQLSSHSSSQVARSYLQQRGLDKDIIDKFQVGFAPPGWDNLLQTLGNTPERLRLLNEAGMVVENEERQSTYDRFRNRIIIPIRDQRGRIVAFGGRVLGDDKPKYLNSPETPVFHKGRELYGLYEARQANRDLSQILVVEGYMDVIALAQSGITCAVATLGTATTADHLNRIFRHTSQVVFCFDGDNAGRQAAWRALENALPVMEDGRQIKFLFLPQGEDPDSLVRKEGAKAFLSRIKDKSQALPFDEYFFRQFEQEIDSSTLDGKARLVHIVTPHLHKLPDGSFKQLMLKKLGDISDLGQDAVSSIVQAQPEPVVQDAQPVQQQNGFRKQEHAAPFSFTPAYKGRPLSPATSIPVIKLGPAQRALRLLLAEPGLAKLVRPEQFANTAEEDTRLLLRLADSARNSGITTTYGLLGSWFGTSMGERLTQLLAIDIPTENAEHVFRQCLLHLSTDEKTDTSAMNDKERLQKIASSGRDGWLVRKKNLEKNDTQKENGSE